MSLDISIIIATYNRQKKLERCLTHLKEQKTKAAFELIVVNDGSKDGTKEFLEKEKLSWKELQPIHQENTGQSRARKHALKKAKGDIILFIDDDIYVDLNFIQKHFDFHQEHPEANKAALGQTDWLRENGYPNRYMEWLTSSGTQFAFHKLKSEERTSFWFFYTSNLSIKKALLEKETFSDAFKGYGWEDIELAYRLEKEHDLELYYWPKAHALHDNPMRESEHKERMKKIAQNALIFQKLHPELNVMPRGIKALIFYILSAKLTQIALKYIKKEWYWYSLSKEAFLNAKKKV